MSYAPGPQYQPQLQQPQPPRRRNGLAIASLCLGLAGLALGLIPILGVFALALGLVGLLLAAIGLWRWRARTASGGLAWSGLAASAAAIAMGVWGMTIVNNSLNDINDTFKKADAQISSIASPPAPTISDSSPAALAHQDETAAVDASSTSAYSTPAEAEASSESATAAGAPVGKFVVSTQSGDTLNLSSYVGQSKAQIVKWARRASYTDDYSTVEAGKRLVAFQIVITNTGSDSLSYNEFGFELVDAEGQTYDNSIGGDIDLGPRLGSGDLRPGAKVKGVVSFEIPTAANIKEVRMDETYGGGSWSIQR